MTMSFNINQMCVSATRCGKSVSTVEFKQRQHAVLFSVYVCVCGGVLYKHHVGWEGRVDFIGQEGFTFQPMLASLFCLGHVNNANSQKQRCVKIRILYECAVLSESKQPVGCQHFVWQQIQSVQVAAWSSANSCSVPESWRAFSISKWIISHTMMQLCFLHKQVLFSSVSPSSINSHSISLMF